MRGVKYVSWSGQSGYACAAKAYVRALAAAGIPVSWAPVTAGDAAGGSADPFPHGERPDPALAPLVGRALEADRAVVHTMPKCWPLLCGRERAAGRRVLGYVVWEFSDVPPAWPALLNGVDALLVPCRWNASVFRDAGVRVPIHVVPHLPGAAARPAPSDGDRRALLARLGGEAAVRGRRIFYTIGEWVARKAMHLTVQAYLEAFTAEDPVLLVVKTSRFDHTRFRLRPQDLMLWKERSRRLGTPVPARQSLGALLRRFRNPPPVALVAGPIPEGEIDALHEIGDCYLSLARSEGWGMGAFDAAWLGKPLVMTRFGGQLEYLPPELSRLVDVRFVPAHDPTATDSLSHIRSWPEPSVDLAADHLRAVLADFEAERARAAHRAAWIRERFAPERTTAALIAAIEGTAEDAAPLASAR